MAYVSIRWGKSSLHHLKYALKDRAPHDVTYAHDCTPETAISDFEAVRTQHNQDRGNQVLHLMQSFTALESTLHAPEDFNSLGRKLALQNFPGHQFVIRTHTDTGKTHNHIILNTVNSETGKKIENKRALIQRLRDSSDKLCRENGLSVINAEAKDRAAKLPFKVQQIVREGRTSYIFDLVQKADVARSISTSFDEYRDTMQAFGIRTLVEEKNVSYFYPGLERGKRGSKLGHLYGKSGLEEAFTLNREKFANNPELKALGNEAIGQIAKYGMPETPEGISKFKNLWDGEQVSWHLPTEHKKVSRRDSLKQFKSERELGQNFVPAKEIKRARENSIFNYCKQNNIALTKNEKGEAVFKGKEFVTVTDFEFKNTRNGTYGSLIDLVAAHKNMSLIQSVAHINGNKRLLLLERLAGQIPHKFKSFYVPKIEKTSAAKIAGILSTLPSANVSKTGVGLKFSEFAINQMGKKGGVWLFYGDENKSNNQVFQYEDALFAFVTKDFSFHRLLLDSKTEKSVDIFLIDNLHIKNVNLVSIGSSLPEHTTSDFFSVLKRKYGEIGFDVVNVQTRELFEKTINIETPPLTKSRGKGAPDISI